MEHLEIELDSVFAAIFERKPRLIGLQFPEGLKTKSQSISTEIETKTGIPTLILIEPIFGACMLADDKAQKLGCDLLIHFGHNRFYKESIPTVYVPVRYNISKSQIKKIAQKISSISGQKKFKTVGLVGTVQTIHALPEIQHQLKGTGLTGIIGQKNGFMEDGQLLGCNYSTATLISDKTNAIFYIGDGRFHPIGLVIKTNQTVFTINPFSLETKEISGERNAFYKKRIGLLAKSLDAHHFGILVSTEKGQFGINKALIAKQQIESTGKTAVILAGDLVKPEYLAGIKVDCILNTACPRIATDDSNNYRVPVIGLYELDFALGKKPLDEYKIEQSI